MNGVNVVSTGPALPNPDPAWHEIAAGRFQRRRQDRHPVPEQQRRARDLADGRHEPAGGRRRSSNPGASWQAKDAADFNGDGKADILWQNDSGTPAVWLMDGMNILATGPALSNPGPSWHEKAAADFNGDGKADILWQNDSGTPAVWLMDGVNVLAMGPALCQPGLELA